MNDLQAYRTRALAELTDRIGVYCLCDLDAVPIYVGQSVDGIRSRVRRHLTSARSDVIANRQIDVWEIAHVWAWPCGDRAEVTALETAIFAHYHARSPLMNGRSLVAADAPVLAWPERQAVQVVPTDEIAHRRKPRQRLPRQIQQYQTLVDYILNVKEADHLKLSLAAHFERMVKYHREFL